MKSKLVSYASASKFGKYTVDRMSGSSLLLQVIRKEADELRKEQAGFLEADLQSYPVKLRVELLIKTEGFSCTTSSLDRKVLSL